MDSDVVLGTLTLIVAAVTPAITYYLGNSKHKMQTVFKRDRETKETTIVLRNVSDKTIFVDRIWLYQSSYIEFEITSYFSEFDICSGQKIEATFQSESLQNYVEDAIKHGKMSKFYRQYESYRLGFRIVVDCSEGIICTSWFKLGKLNDFWTEYDFTSYRKHYYPFGRFYKQSEVTFGYIIVLMIGIEGFAVLEYGKTPAVILMLICYLATLVQQTLMSAGGFRSNHTPVVMAFITGLPLFAAMYIHNPGALLSLVIIYLFSTAYHFLLVKKISGWDL